MTRIIMMICAILIFAGSTAATHAQDFVDYSQPSDVPLMVIRYNQKRVYYDRQLYNAATKALEIKPSVQFSIVSFVPQFGDDSNKETLMNQAGAQTNKLVSELRQMGLPQDRISVSREIVGDSRHHEIYIYVD